MIADLREADSQDSQKRTMKGAPSKPGIKHLVKAISSVKDTTPGTGPLPDPSRHSASLRQPAPANVAQSPPDEAGDGGCRSQR